MDEPIKIETGVPLTKRTRYGKWAATVDKMAPGDCVTLKTRYEAMAFSRCCKRMGYACTTRKQPNGRIKAWLKEKDELPGRSETT